MSRTTVSKGWSDRETRALITERDNLKAELRALLAERNALREAGRFLLKQIKDSSCVTYTGSKATNLHAYKELESILNATLSEGERT